MVVNKVVGVAGASGGARGASLVQGGAGGARAHISVGSGRVRCTLFPGNARGTLVSDVGPRWPGGWFCVVLWGPVSWFGCLWRGFASVALWSRVGSHCEAARGRVSLSLGLPGPPGWRCLCYVMLCYVRKATKQRNFSEICRTFVLMSSEVWLYHFQVYFLHFEMG